MWVEMHRNRGRSLPKSLKREFLGCVLDARFGSKETAETVSFDSSVC